MPVMIQLKKNTKGYLLLKTNTCSSLEGLFSFLNQEKVVNIDSWFKSLNYFSTTYLLNVFKEQATLFDSEETCKKAIHDFENKTQKITSFLKHNINSDLMSDLVYQEILAKKQENVSLLDVFWNMYQIVDVKEEFIPGYFLSHKSLEIYPVYIERSLIDSNQYLSESLETIMSLKIKLSLEIIENYKIYNKAQETVNSIDEDTLKNLDDETLKMWKNYNLNKLNLI